MNLYLLLEGSTEKKIYSCWLEQLLPRFRRVNFHDKIEEYNYYLFSAQGQPSIFKTGIPNAVNEINSVGNYSHFLVCIDAEESSVNEKVSEVRNHIDSTLSEKQIDTWDVKSEIIVQNPCIETWFLGNQKLFSHPVHSREQELQDYIQHYDVSQNDPEEMGIYNTFPTRAKFHYAYMNKLARANKKRYTKKTHFAVTKDTDYLEQLQLRIANHPEHLKTLRHFFSICNSIRGYN